MTKANKNIIFLEILIEKFKTFLQNIITGVMASFSHLTTYPYISKYHVVHKQIQFYLPNLKCQTKLVFEILVNK